MMHNETGVNVPTMTAAKQCKQTIAISVKIKIQAKRKDDTN